MNKLLSPEKQLEFQEIARTLIKWLNDNGNPHKTIIITSTSAELLGGEIGFTTDEYVKD